MQAPPLSMQPPTCGHPPAAVAHAQPPAPSGIELLARETWLDLIEAGMDGNADRACLGVDATEIFAAFNAELGATLAQAVPASAVMRALVTAQDTDAFSTALGMLAGVPAQYRTRCWEAAWSAVVHRPAARAQASQLWSLSSVDLMGQLEWLRRLLEARPACDALQPPLWERAVRLLAREPMRAASLGLVCQLLRLAASAASVPPRAWRDLLRVARVAMQGGHTVLDPAPYQMLGLAPQQQADLDALRACLAMTGRSKDPGALPRLVARIERSVSPHCRCDLLATLCSVWWLHLRGAEAAWVPLQAAMLRLPREDLEQALTALPLSGDLAQQRGLLLERLQGLDPAATLRVVHHHAGQFLQDSLGQALLKSWCECQLAVSRGKPAGHRDTLLALARLAQDTSSTMALDLTVMALQESAELAPRARIGVIALLRFGCLPDGAWTSAWKKALAELPKADTAPELRRYVWALISGLWSQDGRATLLPLLREAVPRLAQQDQAQAVIDMARVCSRCPGGATWDELAWLLRICFGLPFYLRARPLHAIRGVKRNFHEAVGDPLKTLIAAQAAQQAAWAAQLPAAKA